ncbi:exodeoxyribonuclease V subunit alpha [Moraxella caviae]|uniref:RecBCD enzyme subunit RecD n=1 Tax=Moraxella caviae TaxID=34060 RepID=A0A1T0A3A9_9GAMM|nr:exodeoxyribonuclease V subunit alpha [Moraxella caviae]OOR90039.1 exodeoxyribonuclease V subunit alpha [Moraxella caviae]STZ14640.1 Exodeoxyribonuclease V alpha chain [Moraxella caviae]VEW13340.1 Exodeoxyribonuclease V alpha chain [Moraxella caviae]
MNTHAISQYLIRRMNTHADWYQAVATAHKPQKAQIQLFYAVQFACTQALGEGHTLFSLSANDKTVLQAKPTHDDKPAPNTDTNWQLTGWRAALLLPIFTYFGERFFGSALGEHDFYAQILAGMDSCAPQDLERYTKQACARFRLFAQNLGTADKAVQLDDDEALLLLLLRTYYFLRHKIPTVGAHDGFDEFCALLVDNPFFGTADFGGADSREIDDTANLANFGTIKRTAPLKYQRLGDVLHFWEARTWQAERQLLAHVWRIKQAQVGEFDAQNLPSVLNAEQRAAVRMVAKQAFSIITGGPGTGKTFTVAQIVLALHQSNPDLSLALAAPTGKAAQRMSESLQAALPTAEFDLPEPKTIHRLLGIGKHGKPRYDERAPLGYDVVIIDEVSMLGVALAEQLFAAIKTGARLILLGDANQLAAVEAGAVLADLCQLDALTDNRTNLIQSRRFDDGSGVGKLARLINDKGDGEQKFVQALELLASEPELHFTSFAHTPLDAASKDKFYKQLSESYTDYFKQTGKLLAQFRHLSQDEQYEAVRALTDTLNQHRILTAAHGTDFGDELINAYLARCHREFLNTRPSTSPWYHGRVVMVQTNRYDLGLYNGDVGICLYDGRGLGVYFVGDDVLCVRSALLSGDTVKTAYAITTHKSQGSEFGTVAIVFDDTNARLLSQELLYTAVTRAKTGVRIYSTDSALRQSLSQPTVRLTGLALPRVG